MSNKMISDEFIKKISSLTSGATKGELYYILNHTIQQIYPEHDSKEDIKFHVNSVFMVLQNNKEMKK